MTRSTTSLFCTAILIGIGARPSTSQVTRGSVAGFVRDSAGSAIRDVQLGITGTDIHALSDAFGHYVLNEVRPGRVGVGARRLGFSPETVAVQVVAGEVASADLRLDAMPVSIAADLILADPLRGKMGQFNRRKSRGIGSFVTREDIEKRRPSALSEMIGTLPGVGFTQQMAGEPQPVHMQRSMNTTASGNCTVQLYVDGHPYPNGNLDDFSPQTVEGIEVYRSASQIPGDFRTRDATCGVIAIWTRDPDAARRQP